MYDKNNENRTIQSLIELLVNFEILEIKNKQLIYGPRYISFIKSENSLISSLVESNEISGKIQSNSSYRILAMDFLFIIDLIKRYRNETHQLKYVTKNKQRWIFMIENKTLDYEVRLCETLLQLTKLKIPYKIKSPFDEEYYTESGRNAFINYTQYSFLDFYSKSIQNKKNISVLDIGCGYGNYISILKDKFPTHHITGIEKNSIVYSHTSKKFKNLENVNIINDDIFNFQSEDKFDAILINYAIFYFNRSEKKILLNRARKLLSDSGSIIICQYFSQIENLKKGLAIKQEESSFAKKIEMFYGNKIVYANTLWNDTVDTFSESAKWDEFIEIITDIGLHVESLTNADKFYYSLFVELKK